MLEPGIDAARRRPAADRDRVLTTAVVDVARRLGLRATDLQHILGISQPTASRLLHGHHRLAEGGKPFELAAALVRLYRSLSSLVGGDDDLARAWLRSPNRAFDGRRPVDDVRRIDGLLHACEYLDAHRARV